MGVPPHRPPPFHMYGTVLHSYLPADYGTTAEILREWWVGESNEYELERLGWELDSQGATRSETTCLGLCLRVKLSSLGAQGACLALLLRAPSRFYTLSIEILTLFFPIDSGASSHSQHLLTKHATSASGLRCTACPLAILSWRCPAVQSQSLGAPRKDSYFNNNPGIEPGVTR